MMTVCVLGSYREEFSGEEMVILAVVSQENMVLFLWKPGYAIPSEEIHYLVSLKNSKLNL
jgi:hypothetical protein